MTHNEPFDVEGGHPHISITLKSVKVESPFREGEKEIYQVDIEYTSRGLCLPLGWFMERIFSYGAISGEGISVKLLRDMVEEIDPIVSSIDVRLTNGNYSMIINNRLEGSWRRKTLDTAEKV